MLITDCSYAPNQGVAPDVFECATIGGGIRDCQELGKKMLISLGGDTCDGSLGSIENAKKLAYYVWNMFLGGKEMQDKRPFLWVRNRFHLQNLILVNILLNLSVWYTLSGRKLTSIIFRS